MKKTIIKWLFILSGIFGILFLLRLGYGYTLKISPAEKVGEYLFTENNYKRNYASEKYFVKSNNKITSINVDQKYEKVADIKSNTSKFKPQEQQARQIIEEFNALIQFEQKRGNTGCQSLNLLIGVPPENFDSLYIRLTQIGHISGKQITKKDKTNEYKELNAKKNSLEKTINSLLALKNKGGKIEEFMNLENRILDIERQLQNLGVSLGDFDDENEFCTVKFSLQETKNISVSLFHRLKVALEWTVKIYLKVFATLLFITACIYLSLLALEKLKIIQKIISKSNAS